MTPRDVLIDAMNDGIVSQMIFRTVAKMLAEDATTQRDLETANLRCARLEAELEKANNEFGSQTADWPDVWVRIAEVKRIATERYVRLTEAERLIRDIATCETLGGYSAEYIREMCKRFLSPPSEGDKGGGA